MRRAKHTHAQNLEFKKHARACTHAVTDTYKLMLAYISPESSHAWRSKHTHVLVLIEFIAYLFAAKVRHMIEKLDAKLEALEAKLSK